MAKNKKIVRGSVMEVGKMLVQKIFFEGFEITTILPDNAPRNAEFLPALVEKNHTLLWRFQDNHPNYRESRGLAKLVEMGDELFIYLQREKSLELVIPVLDMERMQWVSSFLHTGGRNRSELVEAAMKIAAKFNLTPVWSEVDQMCLNRIEEREKRERELALLAENVAREEEEEERKRLKAEAEMKREAQRATILARKKIKALRTFDSAYRDGYPVCGDEWKILPHDTRCISVSSFNDETGDAGEVLEAFIVMHEKRGKVRRYVSSVKAQQPPSLAPAQKPILPAFKMGLITIDGVDKDILTVDTFDDVKKLRDAGFTNVLVTCTRDGKDVVCSIQGKHISDVSLKNVDIAA